MSESAVPPLNEQPSSDKKRTTFVENDNGGSSQNLNNPAKRSHSEINVQGEEVVTSNTGTTTLESASVSHHHQHHHPPTIILPPVPMEGVFDLESMKALSTPSRSFHKHNGTDLGLDNTLEDEDIGFPEVVEEELVHQLSHSSWDESNGLGDFMVPDSEKVTMAAQHSTSAESAGGIEVARSLDTLQEMSGQVANPISSGDKTFEFSLTSDSNMLAFSESTSNKYALMGASGPVTSTVAAAALAAEDLMEVAINSASLDLFDLDLLDIDNLNKLPPMPSSRTNLSNVFSSSAQRMQDYDSDRSSSIGSNTIISWNEDVPDTSNQTDMDLMLSGIATGKFSESPHSAFVNTGSQNNRSTNSMTRNTSRDVRAKTFVRHNNSNNSSTSNISVESKRSTDSKNRRFSTKQPQASREHINNHYKDPLFQPSPNIFNERYDQLHGINNGSSSSHTGATLTASNLQQNQQNYTFPTSYAPVHGYRDAKDTHSHNSNGSRPNSVRSVKTVSPVSDPGLASVPAPKPNDNLSPALQLQMQAMHLQQQTQPIFQATMPIFATEALQQQYQLLQQQQLAQQQQLLMQQQQQQQALLQQQQLVQQQLAMGLIDPNALLTNGVRGVSPASLNNNGMNNNMLNNSIVNNGVMYTYPSVPLPDHANRGRALSDTSSVQSNITNSNSSMSALRPEKAKRDHSNTSNTNRGNYRCGRCGQPKVNHVCEFIDTSMVSVDTQTFMPIVADFRSMTLLSTNDKIITVIPRRNIDDDYCLPATKRSTPTHAIASQQLQQQRRGSTTPVMGSGTPVLGTPVLGELQSRSNSSTELVPSRPNSGAFGGVVSPTGGPSRHNSGAFEYPNSVLDMNGNPVQYGMQPQMQGQMPPHIQLQMQAQMLQQQHMQQYGMQMQAGQYAFPTGFAPQVSPTGPYGVQQVSPNAPYGQPVYHQISSSLSQEHPPSYPPHQNLVVMNENEADMLMELMDTFEDGPMVQQPLQTKSEDMPQLHSTVSSMSNASSLESGRTSNSSTINLGNTLHRSHPDGNASHIKNRTPFNFNMMCSTEKTRSGQTSGGDKTCTTFFCGSL